MDEETVWRREAELTAIRHSIINLILLLDTSGSMHGTRIDEVNAVMSGLTDLIKEFEEEHYIQVRLRALQFNSVAGWVLGDAEHYVCDYHFYDETDRAIESQVRTLLDTGGTTATAEALAAAREALSIDFRLITPDGLYSRMYAFPPVMILVTDGRSNDKNRYLEELERLKHSLPEKWKDRMIRIAIGLGGAGLDELIPFAAVGTIEHADGEISERVPLVFYYDYDGERNLGKNLESIIWSALASSGSYGRLEDAESAELLPSICEYQDDDVW